MEPTTPTETDLEKADDFLCAWYITMDTPKAEDDVRIDLAKAFAIARTEAATQAAASMQAEIIELCDQQQRESKAWQDKTTGTKQIVHCASTGTWGEAIEKIRAIPLPSTPTTPPQREEGDLLVECQRVLSDVQKDINGPITNLGIRIRHSTREEVDALLSRLTPTQDGEKETRTT